MNSFIRENQKNNLRFIDVWVSYIRTHSDQEWSKQQNVIINSSLRSASITREEFFDMKREKYKQ